MTMYKIEKNVPPPKAVRKRKWPFSELEVGDSTLILQEERNAAAKAACWYGKRSGKRFALRKVDDGVRIWRVE